MLLKKTKTIQIIYIFALGVAVGALLLAFLGALLRAGEEDLILVTESRTKVYDGEPLVQEGWSLKGELKSGHRAEVIFRGEQTDVGESRNEAELRVTDASGADVSADYGIGYEFGTLKVEPRRIEIVSDSAFKTYDGEPLTAPGYRAEGLVIGHRAQAEVTGSITEIGKKSNTVASVCIYDFAEREVTGNYRIVIREGLLAVDGGSGGSIFDGTTDFVPPEGMEDRVLYSVYAETDGYLYLRVCSYGDYNGKGWNEAPVYDKLIGDAYSASYLPGLALEGAGRRVETARIRSFCGNYALPYYLAASGEAQTGDVGVSGNTEGVYEVDYYIMPQNTDILQSPYPSYEAAYREFVFKNYLNIDQTSLRYMQKIIETQCFSADDPDIIAAVAQYIQGAAVYNGEYPEKMEKEGNVAVAFLEKYKEGVCRHYASAAVLLYRALGIPARYTVGVLASAKAGEWVDVRAKSAHAWVEVYLNGVGWVQVEVTGSAQGMRFPEGGLVGEETEAGGDSYLRRVTLKPVTVRYPFDGTEHTAPGVLSGFEQYEEKGYTYVASVSGTSSEPGKTETAIESIAIYDPRGKDVTKKFDIVMEPGILQIYEQKITFTSEDAVRVYGAEDTVPDAAWDAALLPPGFAVEVLAESEAPLDVGLHANAFAVRILNEQGEDVTDRYWTDLSFGRLTVTPLSVTFKAGDASKTYDGEALTCHTVELISGALLKGHTLGFYELSGSQTAIGRSDNEIVHIAIHDANGNNVTRNYLIETVPGKLRVTPRA